MPAYFASDVHLRLDHPERARRFAHWVRSLDPRDTLTIVGDLCDFWLVSRQLKKVPDACEGLCALRDFRERGGELTILPGNHDHWLGSFYEDALGARFLEGPVRVESHGLRMLVTHGHRLGGSRVWKEWMEGQTFLYAFRHCPAFTASALDQMLERFNVGRRSSDEPKQLKLYRDFAASQNGDVDIIVFGHVHTAMDESTATPRLIVLGGWHQQSSYLKVDDSGAHLVITADSTPVSC